MMRPRLGLQQEGGALLTKDTLPTCYEGVPAQIRSVRKEVWEGGPCVHCATLPKGRDHPAPWFRLLAMFSHWSFYYGKRYVYPDTQVSTFPNTFPLAQKLSASQRTILLLLSAAFLKSKSLCKAMEETWFLWGRLSFYVVHNNDHTWSYKVQRRWVREPSVYWGEDGDVNSIFGEARECWVLKTLFFKFNVYTNYAGDSMKM